MDGGREIMERGRWERLVAGPSLLGRRLAVITENAGKGGAICRGPSHREWAINAFHWRPNFLVDNSNYEPDPSA
jgi:hypothetical protein